jgi:poly-gamma-glutamate capsule biosynthesis protein CapA/YwtB (metallophosphatase superfamily)
MLFVLGCNKPDNNTLKICFTGDLLLDRGVRQTIERSGIDTIFSDVTLLFHSSDAVVANLECPITEHYAPLNKRFIFRGEPKWMFSLKKSGITHLAMANNHSNDQGRDGMIETYKQITSNKLIPIGFGNNHTEACSPVMIRKGDINVAIFNSVLLPLENFAFLPDKPCICQASPNELANAIAEYKLKYPKTFVVVLLHWGYEYQSVPEPSQRAEAIKLIESGADAIIGHHPHVVQIIEFIKNKPVIYSLGNFVFDSKRPEASKGLIVKLIVSKNKISIFGNEIIIKNCIPSIVKEYVIKDLAHPVSHNKRKILLKTLEQQYFTSIETCFISY